MCRVKREKFASPNAKDTNMLVFLALGNAKELSFALDDTKVPYANDFAFWWNIGFTLFSLKVAWLRPPLKKVFPVLGFFSFMFF